MTKVEKAVQYMKDVAKDRKHGYDQINRWGNPGTWSDYDCSSLVISAYDAAGVKVKAAGATYTENMYAAFTKCGFKDVTSKINLSTGSGLIAGDVLLNHKNHTAMMTSDKQLTEASINENNDIYGGKVGDQTGREIWTHAYYNYPWNCVLRYPEKILDSEGYRKGQKTIGVYNLKQLIILAKKKGVVKQGVNDDYKFGEGTEKAVNELLAKWGYAENGVAGENFSRKLREEIDKATVKKSEKK